MDLEGEEARSSAALRHGVTARATSTRTQPELGFDAAAWDAYVARHRDGSLFHSSLWLKIVQDVFGKPVYRLTVTDSAGQLIGVLPVALCRGLRQRALVSVPFRDHGGPLADSPAEAEALLEATTRLAAETRAARISLLRASTAESPALEAAGFQPARQGVDTRLDLGMSEEEHWRALSSPVRRAVRKAAKSGLVVRPAESTHAWRTFYELFVATRRRLGIPAFPWGLFHRLSESGPASCNLLLARTADGKVAGGLLVLAFGSVAYSGYLGYHEAFRSARIVDALFWEAIRWARRTGRRAFFFGSDSPRQEGLIQYKRKWLAEAYEVVSWHWTRTGVPHSPPDTEGPGYQAVRAAFRLGPMPLFRLASRLSLKLWE